MLQGPECSQDCEFEMLETTCMLLFEMIFAGRLQSSCKCNYGMPNLIMLKIVL